jgi:hypothetical protein
MHSIKSANTKIAAYPTLTDIIIMRSIKSISAVATMHHISGAFRWRGVLIVVYLLTRSMEVDDRVWTSERLQRHGLQNSGPCALCSQAREDIHHFFLGCVYSREVWFHLLRRLGLQRLTPSSQRRLDDWWLRSRKLVTKSRRRGFDSMVVLVAWLLWRERNDSVQWTARACLPIS